MFILTICTILIMMVNINGQCGRERCCNINPCTSSYCTSKNTQTWISSQNFANYGYTKLVLANTSCLPCPYNCKTCSSQIACNSCSDQFYSYNGQCLLCPDRCSSCQLVNSIFRCSSCSDGAYLDTKLSSCLSCPIGAKTCISKTVINTCKTGYLKSSNSLFCTRCPDNCLSCPTSDSICSACATGYYLLSSLCYNCSLSNCISCTRVSSTKVCTLCSNGYRLVSGNCLNCPSQCQKCSSATVCTQCNSGYYISGGSCIQITSSVSNCDIYKNQTSCNQCASGYYLSSNICFPCSITCSQCDGRHFGSCTTCNSNSALFNKMCLLLNFPSQTTYQKYYSVPQISSLLSGGVLSCQNTLYQGKQIYVTLNDLSAYQIDINWKMYTLTSLQYSVTLNQNIQTFVPTSSSYTYCSTTYFLTTQSASFTKINLQNTLIIKSASNVAFEEMIIVAKRCNTLCTQCSNAQCTACVISNLYTQDAYCVFSCSKGYYTYQTVKSCLKECPIGTFPQITDVTCQPCVSPCLSCLTRAKCSSCVDGYYLSNEGQCFQNCPFKFYGRVETKTCQKCVGRCLECTSQEACLNCKIGFLYKTNSTCLDNCNFNGYYSNISTLSCEECSSACKTCSFSASRCTSCPSGTVFYKYQCLSSCPSGFYNQTGTCSLCSYPCEQCSINSTSCLSCIDRYLKDNNCLAACPDGYYEDNVFLRCNPCSSKCSKCILKSEYCSECQTGYFYYNYECNASCPAGFYPSGKICIPCVGCLTCVNQSYCNSCSSNFLQDGQCKRASDCKNGTYANIQTLRCETCHIDCKRCEFESTKCVQCQSNSSKPYLENFLCLSSCSSSYFYPSNGKCVDCEQPCLTCLNKTACLSCIQGYKYSNNVCSSTCSAGTFFNVSISDCSVCSTNCVVCTSSNFCQLCQNSFYIKSESSTSATCVSSCPSTYFANSQTSSCQKCLFPCDNCSSSIDCLSCQTGVLYQSRCIANCPDSTYLSGSECLKCLGNCLTCTINATKCKLCKEGYFLKDSVCQSTCPSFYYPELLTQSCLACPITCSICTNSTLCTSCIVNKTFLEGQFCVAYCPPGKYGSYISQRCELCSDQCKTCNQTADNCLTCASDYLLVRINSLSFQCSKTCPVLYYQQSQICYPCLFPCVNCISSIKCSTCVVGKVLHQPTSSCLNSCPTETYTQNSTCKPCTSPCFTCLNSSYCQTCISNLKVFNGLCLSTCPEKYYAEDSAGICNECSGQCKTCISQYKCLTCNSGYGYDGYCYSSCPSGTYSNLTESVCRACQSPCLECSGSQSYCKRCIGNLYAYKGNCSNNCPESTYTDVYECMTCTFPCLTCQNQFTCKTCVGGYLMYLSKICISNVDKCPNDYYKKDSIECVPVTQCPQYYFKDEVEKTCAKVCDRTKYTDIATKTCSDSCSPGQYIGANLICQNFLTNPPTSLLGMTAIAYIKSSRVYIDVIFNQSVSWSQNPNNLFIITQSQARLLQQTSIIGYQSISDTQLQLQLMEIPYQIFISLAPYYVTSNANGLPLQTIKIGIKLPEFTAYSHEQTYTGNNMGQFSEGISWFIILFSFLFVFNNRLSDLYILWDTAQLLYTLMYLNLQYPPSLNEFFYGLRSTHFEFLPSIFSTSPIKTISSSPFYAYSYDNNFLRTSSQSIFILIIIGSIYLVFKFCQILLKKVEKVRAMMDKYPKARKFIYNGLLRFRWHHASDFFFLTYLNVMIFGVSQLYYLTSNPGRLFSNIICICLVIVYIIFPFFVGYKLYKHYPNISKGKLVHNLKCFYRGIEKENKFGVSMIILRYLRKLVYAIVIGIFSMNPMFALPILMSTSFLLAIFIIANKPFKKKVENIVTFITEVSLVIVYGIIALLQFLANDLSSEIKQALGWICSLILTATIFALVFEIFCKTIFYLAEEDHNAQTKTQKSKKGIHPGGGQNNDDKEQYLREEAGKFFDRVFPKLRQNFDLLNHSEDQIYPYEQGDSQDSQNNDLRQRDWGIDQEGDQFNNYDYNTESQNTASPKKKPPNYLIRCVKNID